MARKLFLAALVSLLAVSAAAESHFAAARQRMVDTIRGVARTVPVGVDGGAINPAVLDVMREVPRHELVPADVRSLAYADTPLAIGHGQTISQPYIVALMTSLARTLRPSRSSERSAPSSSAGWISMVNTCAPSRASTAAW